MYSQILSTKVMNMEKYQIPPGPENTNENYSSNF